MAKPNAKQKLLAIAPGHFLGKGYSACTVDELCEAAVVSKGSFYHFFQAKDDIAIALIEEYSTALENKLFSDLPRAASSRDQVIGFLDHLSAVAPEVWKDGCILAAFAQNMEQVSPQIADAASEQLKYLTARIADIFEPFCLEISPLKVITGKMLADQFMAILQGAILLAKSHKEPDRINMAIQSFKVYIKMLK